MVSLRLVVALIMAVFIGLISSDANAATVIVGAAAAAIALRILRGRSTTGFSVVVALGALWVVAAVVNSVFSGVLSPFLDSVISGPAVAVALSGMLTVEDKSWGSVGLRVAPSMQVLLVVLNEGEITLWAYVAAFVAGFVLAACWESGGVTRTARSAGLFALLLGLAATLLVNLFDQTSSSSSPSPQHPALGSVLDIDSAEEIQSRLLFLVDSERPDRWRIQTFDSYDGRLWSPAAFEQLGNIDRDGEFTVTETVLAFDYVGNLIPARPTPYAATSDFVGAVVGSDGTVLSTSRLEPGIGIEVLSWERPTTPGNLRASDRLTAEMPARVAPMAESTATTTERTLEAASTATAGANNNYDRTLALVAYLNATVRLSDGSTPPDSDQDRVDWLLFDAGHGRDSQINAALVVLARAVGIPARLVAGFEPTVSDPRTGDWLLFQENTELWAEIWFPGSGWVIFDPAATASPHSTNQTMVVLLGLLAVVVLASVVASIIWLRRRSQRHFGLTDEPRRQPAVTQFEDLARLYQVNVSPPSTLLEIGSGLAETELGRTGIADVGQLLDRDRFGTPRLTPTEWSELEAVLDEARAIAAQSGEEFWSEV